MSDDVLDLLEQAPAPPMSIDPYEAVLGGRRRLGRRRVGFAVAAVAAVAVVVAVATQLPGAAPSRPVPAGPTTVNGSPTTTAALLEFGGERYEVRVVPQPGDPLELSFRKLSGDPAATSWSLIGGVSGTGLGDDLTYGTDPDGGDVILGVVSSGARSVSAFFGGAEVNTESRRKALPGTAYDAFAIRLHAPATTKDLWFLMWTDAKGHHHTTDGASTRSAVFSISRTDDPVVLWGDRERGAWGLTGGGLSASREGIKTPEVQFAAWPAGPGESGWAGAYGLLPAGARDIEVTAPPGGQLDGDVQWQALEDVDATAFLAVLDPTTAGSASGWAPRVTWMNANGTRGSFSVGGG